MRLCRVHAVPAALAKVRDSTEGGAACGLCAVKLQVWQCSDPLVSPEHSSNVSNDVHLNGRCMTCMHECNFFYGNI